MEGLLPCPYCGGEVEVIKLIPRGTEPRDIYRIECRECRALCARGDGFAGDTPSEKKLRIQQYKEKLEKKSRPLISSAAKRDANGKRNPFRGYDSLHEV